MRSAATCSHLDSQFTQDGKDWQHSRAMLRPSFARGRTDSFARLESHIRDLQHALPTNVDGWTDAVDLQPLFFRLNLAYSLDFLFGKSDTSSPPNDAPTPAPPCPSAAAFAAAFESAQATLGVRAKLFRNYWLHDPPAFRAACAHCHAFIDHHVSRALARRAHPASPPTPALLDDLIQQTTDSLLLRSQLLNILIAGRDTTAALLSWLFLELARHPAVLTRLRAALAADLPSSAPLNPASLAACTYLQWCLSETLRLYPAVPVNSRSPLRDTTLPHGGGPDGTTPVLVRRGQPVVFCTYALHRDPMLWGADADEFRPERWRDRKGGAGAGWDYIPFGAGPRVCLGQRHALATAGAVAVGLLRRFGRGLENAGAGEVRMAIGVTARSAGGCWVRLRE